MEPATGWNAPQGLTYDQVVRRIIEHRRANRQYRLATDYDVVAQQLDDYTCARLKNDPSWCVDSPPSSFTVPLPRRSRRAEGGGVAGGARFVASTSAGIKLWMDWFGEGKPVEQAVAERRAAICADCPQNDRRHGNIFEMFTVAAAKEIMAIFSALNDLNLHTSKDNVLKVCQACDCPLKAKVWAPLQIIKKHLPEERFERLHSACWIRHE